MDKRILIVDDEPDIIRTVSMALELSGYTVATAATAAEAMEAIRNHPPDLIVIDMVLPGMSGKDIAGWVKNTPEYKKIPLILITALAQKDEAIIYSGSIDHYLIKPFDLNHLEDKIKELLGKPG